MSAFAQALEEAGPPRVGRHCMTCLWFDQHPDERADVEAAYREAPNRAHIWRIFKATFEPEFTQSAFDNHFRREHDR